MAILPSEYLDAVAVLCMSPVDQRDAFIATGFIYGYHLGPSGDGASYRLALVTNRHVIQGNESLFVRLNRSGVSVSDVYQLPAGSFRGPRGWTTHPDDDCDVAVYLLDPNQLQGDGIEFHFFLSDQQLTIDRARSLPIREGDGVFVLGFPLGMAGTQRKHPIVRQGIIARIRDWLEGTSRTVLIDASVFPGNSGGPVVTKPEVASLSGTTANKSAALLGMVASYVPYPSDVATRPVVGRQLISYENSGLAHVVPVDVIHETVELAIARFDSTNDNDSATGGPPQ